MIEFPHSKQIEVLGRIQFHARMVSRGLLLQLMLACSLQCAALGDWPMLRGNPSHSGFVQGEVSPRYHLAWAVEIGNERLGTAMEPIVYRGKVYVGTHAGNLYALNAETGKAVWAFQTGGAFLQSAACADGWLIAGNADGSLYALSTERGRLAWHRFIGSGGFSAAPIIAEGIIYLGTRGGELLAVSLRTGEVLWRVSLPAPVRQTAAVDESHVYVTTEDLRVRCFRSSDGQREWVSDQLVGQTARDYYPVAVHRDQRTWVVVRTNPILNMARRIGEDRSWLCRQASIDDSTWNKLEAWTRSTAAKGTPELWRREQDAIVEHLEKRPEARTFFVLDSGTGRQAVPPPILWIGGCQGVGAQPASDGEGRFLVFYRSAYGNWNQGVAPLVALGLLDLDRNRVTPLFHQQGPKPAWNCFWGTADESQNFLIVGETVLIIHQGTLSGFNLSKNELFPIWGERDTFGGFSNPQWARNEWHGPARSGVAYVEGRIFWQTGSRILCLEPGEANRRAPKPVPIEKSIATTTAPSPPAATRDELVTALAKTTEEALSKNWAPLFNDPGLAGRFFSFDNSADLFEAWSRAYPYLPAGLRSKVKTVLDAEWKAHPPFTRQAWYSLKDGARREWFWVPPDLCERWGNDQPPHPFGNVYAAWLFGTRCGNQEWVKNCWAELTSSYRDFVATGWRLNAAKGDIFANRYLASLLVFCEMAKSVGDLEIAHQARTQAEETLVALVQWWQRAAEEETLKTFSASAQLDSFIGQGDAIWLALAPHRHKVGLLQDMTPEVAALIRTKAPKAVEQVWNTFVALCPTWHLTGEERQVHTGENFVDPPDFALNAFKAFAWLKQAPAQELDRRVDLPSCRADLYYATKLAIALDAQAGRPTR